ncbi:MAG: hypothetical protein R3190_14355 [Thermoanaerobaculia bacterium]|nr:hypothetical protein [Thermoanaerobaculia bacterium]
MTESPSDTAPDEVPRDETSRPTAAAPGPTADATADPPLRKSPRLAAFLSFFPGLGNVYNGLYLRGVTFFVLFLALVQLAGRGSEDLWAPCAAFVWFFNVIDAYRQARLINHGIATDLGLVDEPKLQPVGQGTLLSGVVLFLVGLVALLDLQLGIDLDWLLDFWPVGLMALGAWFVWAGVRSRRTAALHDDLLGAEAEDL